MRKDCAMLTISPDLGGTFRYSTDLGLSNLITQETCNLNEIILSDSTCLLKNMPPKVRWQKPSLSLQHQKQNNY